MDGEEAPKWEGGEGRSGGRIEFIVRVECVSNGVEHEHLEYSAL